MTYNLAKLSIQIDQSEVNKLRLKRHSSIKRSNRKLLAKLKEEILILSEDEKLELKGLI